MNKKGKIILLAHSSFGPYTSFLCFFR